MTDPVSRRRTLRTLARLAAGGCALPMLAAGATRAATLAPPTDRFPDPCGASPDCRPGGGGPLLMRGTASKAAQRMAAALAAAAPQLASQTLLLATQALEAARRAPGMLETSPPILGVIDFSRPSTEKRLWVFDLRQHTLVHEEWVAHGRNSGDNMAVRFSNVVDSRMSSLGAFVAAEPYQGSNGYSLRLRGLEPGFNDRAMERAIVMHGAPYVNETIIRTQGRLGRSWGCPAMRPAVAREVIDRMAGGGFLFGYYPDPDWLAQSPLIGGLAQSRA